MIGFMCSGKKRLIKENTVIFFILYFSMTLFVVPFISAASDNVPLYVKNTAYEHWKRLSPQEKRTLRERHERYERLPPHEKELLRKRYEQWRQLPPEERETMRKYLENWNRLTPEQRKMLRQKFGH